MAKKNGDDDMAVAIITDEGLKAAADIEVSRQDLVEVAMVEVEEVLHKQEKALTAKRADLTTELEAANKKLRSECDSAVSKLGNTKEIKALIKSMKALGFEDLKVVARGGDTAVSTIIAGVDDEGNKPKLQYSLAVLSPRMGELSSKKFNLKMTPGMTSALKASQKLHTKLSAVRAEAIEVRGRLSDIPMYERKLKASITKNMLSGTERGLKLLDALTQVDTQKLLEG